ncbi:MAG: hypothetical protein WCC87_05910 [Candidatus Korobacteraceae bacterium]
MDNFEQIRTDTSNWLNEHPYAKDVTSGALEVIPFIGPTLRNIFERSTKSEDDKTLILTFLRTLQDASDEQLKGLSKLNDISGGMDELLARSLHILSVLEETNVDVKKIKEKLDTLPQNSDQAKADFWKQFDLTLDAIVQLVSGHAKLINRAVAPLLDGRPDGLEATAKQFRALVFNDELPLGYAKAHAHLDGWYYVEEFRSEVNEAKRTAVNTELFIFQYAVFPMMSQSGYLGDFGFGSAAKLWSLLSQESAQDLDKEELQRDICDNFLRAFRWLTEERSWHESHGRKLVQSRLAAEQYERMLELSELNTPDGVIKPVREWCREWQYLVNQQLWTNNLEGAIARLRTAKYDHRAEPE